MDNKAVCRTCKRILPPRCRFCPYCGSSVDLEPIDLKRTVQINRRINQGIQEPEKEQSEYVSVLKSNRNTKHQLRLWFAFAGVVVLLFMTVLFTVFLYQKGSGRSSEPVNESGSYETNSENRQSSGSIKGKGEEKEGESALSETADCSEQTKELFQELADDLRKEYGFIDSGERAAYVDSKQYYNTIYPEEGSFSIDDVSYGEGVIFTDVSDYDHDGAEELLSLRRKNGTITDEENDSGIESGRSDYIFEMYEMTENGCVKADSITAGVFDILNWSINYTSMTVFCHEMENRTDLCIETYICQQDHPDDTALIKIRYEDGKFSFIDGIRFGYWFRENGLICMEPLSSRVIDYLNIMFPSSNNCWEYIAETNSSDDKVFVKTRKRRIGEMGISIIRTRLDVEESYNSQKSDDLDDEETEIKISRITALDCYAPMEGSFRALAFFNEYTLRAQNVITLKHSVALDVKSGIDQNNGAADIGKKEKEASESHPYPQNDGEYIFPDSDRRLLTMEDISGLDEDTLIFARNEIYARHGRKFVMEKIQAYFNSKSWYYGTIEAEDFPEDLLNEVERANAEFMLSYEKSLKD